MAAEEMDSVHSLQITRLGTVCTILEKIKHVLHLLRICYFLRHWCDTISAVVPRELSREPAKQAIVLFPIFSPKMTDFQNSSLSTLSQKSATNSSLKISQHLKRVAALPCEILTSEN